MSARLETLHEQLAAVRTEIASKRSIGEDVTELLEQERSLAAQLTRARGLLTEHNNVLKG